MILDPARMEAALTRCPSYRGAKPFPHGVLTDVFDPAVLRRLADQFPSLEDPAWHSNFNLRPESKKHSSTGLSRFASDLATSLVELNTAYFLNWLEKLTGISGLVPDPYFLGGCRRCRDR